MSLNTKAWLGVMFLAVAMSLLIFGSAGTVRYWEAWVYLGVFFGATVPITFYLMKYDPALLRRRLSGGPIAEKEKTQKIIMFLASLGFIASLVVPALEFRSFGDRLRNPETGDPSEHPQGRKRSAARKPVEYDPAWLW